MLYNKELFYKSLEEAISSVLEGMIFAEMTSAMLDVAKETSEPVIRVRMDIKEPFKGLLILISTQKIAHKMAQGMYGEPKGDFSEKMIQDVLSEFLNVTAGRFLKKVTPESSKFTLSVPTVCPTYPIRSPNENQIGVVFEFDAFDEGGWLQLILSLES